MEFTPLEREVLDWIAHRSSDNSLLKQIENVQPKEREVSDVGTFLDLTFPKDFESNAPMARNPIQGPEIKSTMLKNGAGSLLFIADGKISVLEIFAKDENFPEELSNYTLVSQS